MRTLIALLLLLFAAMQSSCGGGSSDGSPTGGQAPAPSFPDLTAAVRKPLEASNNALGRAAAVLATSRSKRNPELVASVAAAQTAVQDLIRQQEGVVQQLAVIARLGQQLQSEKAALEKDKVALERRETLFSTGFYAALITALVAIASVLGKFPMQRLEMRLKRLEIEEKEHELRRKKTGSGDA